MSAHLDDPRRSAASHQGVPQPETLRWIRELVGFPSVSRDSNLDLIHHIRDRLATLGVDSTVLPNHDGTKANLWARIGPEGPGGVVLSGHTDVVPTEGQDWATDPFSVVEREGAVYGRGTADMKGFIACALAMVPRMLEAPLRAPVHLCFSYDEEVGCQGVDGLIDHLNGLRHKPDWCLVGEPTGMDVVTGHKGKLAVRCDVIGHAAHSSLAPTAVNAVQEASRLVARLADMADSVAEHGPFDDRYDVSHTTLHVGVMSGGRALNIVPDLCSFDFECRHLPGQDPLDILETLRAYGRDLEGRMHRQAPESGIQWTTLFQFPGLDMVEDHEAVTLMKRLAGVNYSRRVAYGTEAGKFQTYAGIPAVICGPGHIDQAHKPDEFVALDQLAAMEGLLGRLIDHLSR